MILHPVMGDRGEDFLSRMTQRGEARGSRNQKIKSKSMSKIKSKSMSMREADDEAEKEKERLRGAQQDCEVARHTGCPTQSGG